MAGILKFIAWSDMHVDFDLMFGYLNKSLCHLQMASGAAELPPPEYMTFTMGSPHEPERGAGWSYYNASS
jgi:hypothetical protein